MSGHAQPPRYPTPEERRGKSEQLSSLAYFKNVPDGYPGTAQIIDDMKRLVLEAYKDERLNQLARQITMGCPPHDHACEATTVLEWFQTSFRYTKLPFHPKGFQRLQTPSYTLFDAPVRSGECASLSTAMAAILMSLGFEVAFRTAGQDVNNPLDFEHVYVVVNVPSVGWVPADPSYQNQMGWEHPAALVRKDWLLT